MNSGKVIIWIVGSLIISTEIFAQSVSIPELIRVPYKSHKEKEQKEYFLYLPYGYKSSSPERKWPVIMFLHGNGERGNGREDLDWVMKQGPLYEAWIQKRDLPFIIISPQLPMFDMDTVPYIRDRDRTNIPVRLQAGVPERPLEFYTPKKMSPEAAAVSFPDALPPSGWEEEEDDLMDMIKTVIDDYHGDPDRIYLTGLSYGGFGTWYLANKHPKTWAAICPVVGWGHPDLMEPIAKYQIPLWVFAGGRDPSVYLRYFYAGLNKLEELGHKDVRFTIEADMGHDVWGRVYAGEDVYEWMLTHKRK